MVELMNLGTVGYLGARDEVGRAQREKERERGVRFKEGGSQTRNMICPVSGFAHATVSQSR